MALTLRKKAPKERTLMLCDEMGNLGKIEAFLTAATLLRSSGLTLWSFFQNADQLKVYEPLVNTLVDNAGVLQFFGPRNRRMAQEFANLMGVGVEQVMRMGPDEQLLLIEGGEPKVCRQVRYYTDETFTQGPGLGPVK